MSTIEAPIHIIHRHPPHWRLTPRPLCDARALAGWYGTDNAARASCQRCISIDGAPLGSALRCPRCTCWCRVTEPRQSLCPSCSVSDDPFGWREESRVDPYGPDGDSIP